MIANGQSGAGGGSVGECDGAAAGEATAAGAAVKQGERACMFIEFEDKWQVGGQNNSQV